MSIARERRSFRSNIRAIVGAQVVVIVIASLFALYGAIRFTNASDRLTLVHGDLVSAESNLDDFPQIRAQLDILRVDVHPGQLTQIAELRRQLIHDSARLRRHDLGAAERSVTRRDAQIRDYFERIVDPVVAAVRRDDLTAARALISDAGVAAAEAAISRSSRQLLVDLREERRAARAAVVRSQAFSIAIVLISAIVLVAGGIALMFWIRRQMIVPLEGLAIASRRLGHGDLAARVEPSGIAEIALAGQAFNQMADEIEQHVGQMHELSAARSRFVSSVSHELRTPITSMRGYLDLLAKGEAGSLTDDQLKFVSIADRNARQLNELIDDLLTMSRVQGGRINLRPEVVNVRDLLRELKVEMLPIATERGIDLVLVDTGDLMVSGDPVRLRQTFGNLLSNSIKYSHDDQSVVVRAFAVNRQAVISFVDWGVGISDDDLPQIAEPFFRAGSAGTIPGTGLGLAIAKQMVELHGGRLAVESELGGGSTFTAYLPLLDSDGSTPESETEIENQDGDETGERSGFGDWPHDGGDELPGQPGGVRYN